MTEVRTFRASNMQEALAAVRRELGPEAVILNSREEQAQGVWPWSRRAAMVEVTAGRNVTVATTRVPDYVQMIAAAQVAGAAKSSSDVPSHSGIASTTSSSVATPTREWPPRGRLQTPDIPARTAVNAIPEARAPRSMEPLEAQVQSLQTLLEQLSARLEPDRSAIPTELFGLYSTMLDAEVSEETARRLLTRLQREFTPTEWSEARQSRLLLAGLVESELSCSGAIRPSPTRRKVIALVGPTGVGKTTTIAKLAANFKLRAGLRVGLVTVDTYRIAAVDQLRTYAEIIDIPMQVVTGPRDLSRALAEMADLDLVFIDTAGRSPADELQLNELKTLLTEVPVDEVHLVLSLAASARALQKTAQQFAAVRTSAVILTKLDESPGLGHVLSALPELHLPVSYLTTGQNVPDDIEPAVASRLARLVLGLEGLRPQHRN